MPLPELAVQTSFVRPTPLKLELSVLWTPHADHCIVRTSAYLGTSGDLVAMGVGSAPSWQFPDALNEALSEHLERSISRIYSELVNPDPF
uniref:Uncharacterized protein n=1 Tax=uncultured prokaryote TaxID=198431 RepID=A0A0H5Q8S3_9ZZZZ|nr:hypothetical protein [uncultured prokaryote]